MGLGASVIGFTTLPIMYLVGRVIAAATHPLALKTVLYALFLVALAAPFLLLAFAWSRFPKFTDAFSRYYAKLLKFDYRTIAALLSGLGARHALACVNIGVLRHLSATKR